MYPTDEQKAMLAGKLSPDVVKARKQGGRNVSYIEGWYAVQTANRIFGVGEWSYQINKLVLIGEREFMKPNDDGTTRKGYEVAYLAEIQVNAANTYFHDVGFGNGTDYNSPLSAHELAAKEAVTDGVKRCLKNYGDPFGLTLYDKTQAGVGYDEAEKPKPLERGEAAMAKAKAPQAAAPEATGVPEASTAAIGAYYQYAIDTCGIPMEQVEQQLTDARDKFGGIIPAGWPEAKLANLQARYKAKQGSGE